MKNPALQSCHQDAAAQVGHARQNGVTIAAATLWAHDDCADALREQHSRQTSIAGQPVVFVVDDDAVALQSVEGVLRRHGYVVRSFASPASFLRAIEPSTPGCVVLELSPSEVAGLDVQKELFATGHRQPVVFLSANGTVRSAVQAMKAGAEDVIDNPFEEGVLVSVVERALERDRRERSRRIENGVCAARFERLTPRERQVLGQVIAGRMNKQIAARLGTAEKTIKVHRARVMYKMAVRSVAELVRVADFVGIQPAA